MFNPSQDGQGTWELFALRGDAAVNQRESISILSEYEPDFTRDQLRINNTILPNVEQDQPQYALDEDIVRDAGSDIHSQKVINVVKVYEGERPLLEACKRFLPRCISRHSTRHHSRAP